MRQHQLQRFLCVEVCRIRNKKTLDFSRLSNLDHLKAGMGKQVFPFLYGKSYKLLLTHSQEKTAGLLILSNEASPAVFSSKIRNSSLVIRNSKSPVPENGNRAFCIICAVNEQTRRDYLFMASSMATATETVAPTMGLLPMPMRPIIST